MYIVVVVYSCQTCTFTSKKLVSLPTFVVCYIQEILDVFDKLALYKVTTFPSYCLILSNFLIFVYSYFCLFLQEDASVSI